jgi:XTP/dITP diphosphohydrolase
VSELLLATRSRGKVAEFRELLAPLGVTVRTPDECGLPEQAEEATLEDAESFVDNATAKALWFGARLRMVTLADDSGLEVDALSGAPGVHSKRFAGLVGADHDVTGANNAALLAAMGDVPEEARGARYRCVLVLHRPAGVAWGFGKPAEGELLVTEGFTAGRILTAADGEHGFGYDPLFWSADLQVSFGRAAAAGKGAVSHRGRAVRAMLAALGVG